MRTEAQRSATALETMVAAVPQNTIWKKENASNPLHGALNANPGSMPIKPPALAPNIKANRISVNRVQEM